MNDSIELLKEMLSEQMIEYNIDADDETKPSWKTETPKGIDSQINSFDGNKGAVFYLDRTTEPGIANMTALYFDISDDTLVNITRDEYKKIE